MGFLKKIIDKISGKPKDNQWLDKLPKINTKQGEKGEEIWRKYISEDKKPEVHRTETIKGFEIESNLEKSSIQPEITGLNDIQKQYEINEENEPIEPNVTKGMIDPEYEQFKCAICDKTLKNQKYFRCNLCFQQMCAKCLINHKCGGNGSDHYGKITNLGDGRILYQPKKSGK